MKRVLAFLVTVVMLLAVLPTGVAADTDDFSYATREDGVYLISYDGAGGNVTLDASFGGKPVVGIVYSAFMNDTSLTGITLPASLTTIDDNAFEYCTKLSSFRSEGLKTLGDYALGNCTMLKDVTLPETTETIGASAFAGCTSLKAITLPDSVTSIGKNTFLGDTSLETVKFPANLHTVVYGMFNGCSALTAVTLPDSVTTIEGKAFKDCTKLTKVTIGEGVTTIAADAFDGATNLTLYVKKGSYAQTYAETYGIPYVSCEHKNTHQVVTVSPMYTKVGSANIVCNDCDEIIDTIELPVLSLEANFKDIKNNDWFAEAARFCLDNNMIKGTDATHLALGANMTRASLVMILYRMENSPAVTYKGTFTDVPNGTWFTDAVLWAADKKIVNGTSANTFGPNKNITRQEIAAILYRYAKEYKKFDVSKTGNLSTFNDAASVASWATTAFSWANGMGIITGAAGNLLAPAKNASRAEVITMLYRFCKAYPEV